MALYSLRGKVMLVTGASSGIGEFIAREAAAHGADLMLCARRVDRLLQLQSELVKFGVRAEVAQADVGSEPDMQGVVERARATFGQLDFVVANAGVGVVGAFADLSDQDYQRQFATNIYGVLHTARATLPDLCQSRGVLAIVSSVSAYISTPGDSPYSMSKAAVRAFADSLYLEYKPRGVAITLICPGFVKSEIRHLDNQGNLRENSRDPIPAWLAMDTSKAARQIVDGIVARRRELIVTGHGIFLVWLRRHFPGVFFYILAKLMKSSKTPIRSRQG